MDGVLIINKEANMTSHDVVFKLRKILNTKKIGHSGTLDPNATGVLVVLVGKACKILPFIEDVDKHYIASLQLGSRTFTDDVWGDVLETKPITPIQDFESVLKSFEGRIKQVPPKVSSIKVNGKKLYEYARNNEEVELPVREVDIFKTEVLDEENLRFLVHCGSGTYVRSLCVDIANKTNNLGCMSSLIRSQVGKFSLEQAYTLQQVANGAFSLYSIKDMLAHYTQIQYDKIQDVYHGKAIQLSCEEDEVVICDKDEVVSIYRRRNGNTFICVRGLF